MRWLALLALALLMPVMLLAVGFGGSNPRDIQAMGTIAFIRGDRLWVMRADGSGQRVLPTGRYPTRPAWSPDGRTIAFSADDKDTYNDVYAISADGTGRRRSTRLRVDAVEPVWSPDGRSIAVDAYYDGTYAIYVVGANGGRERRLTPGDQFTGPSWSSDGRRIAFTRIVGRTVYVMNRDGSGRRVLVKMGGSDSPYALAWSPAGRHIAFIHAGSLWVMNADGTRLRRLANPRIEKPGRRESDLAWSPDGRRIAFVVREGRGRRGDPDVDFDIFVVNSDLSGLRNLTENDRALDRDPVWSSDGRAIAFTSDRDGNSEIYVMNANGSRERNLSKSPLQDLEPAWSPKG